MTIQKYYVDYLAKKRCEQNLTVQQIAVNKELF